MARRRDRNRRPTRHTGTRTPRRRLLVLCEGQVTEPSYLEGFKREVRNPAVVVEITKDHGVPRTLVELAKARKHEADERARRERDDNLRYDEVWCVFDVDEHPKLDEALTMARDNEISIALSNPCFELWLLLHFRDSPGMQHRHPLQKMLRKYVAGYDKHLDFAVFAPHYDTAVGRADRLERDAVADGEIHRNPTTGVHHLTRSIGRRDD